jgi:hypothetical protein
MKPWERRTFHVLAVVVSLSGFAYLWMKYFLESADPFSVVNHPWQTAMLAVHVVASPGLILLFGIIFNSHIVRKLRIAQLPNRRSGYLSLGTLCAMILSGYFLQVSTNERWLRALVIVHVASALAFSLAYVSHLVIAVARARRQPGPVLSEVA